MSTLNVATVNATTTLNTSSINDGPLAGLRNRIINGNGVINQRGAQTSISHATYFVDRWRYGYSGAAVVNGSTVNGYIEIDVTTADTSIAAGDYAKITQRIEAYNIDDFLLGTADAKTVTLSFKHKHTKTGTYCVGLTNNASNRTYTFEYTQSVSDAEETHSEVISLDTTGTWVTGTNGNGLGIDWVIAGGTNFQGTADTWTAGYINCTSNQVNGLDSTSNYFRITDVQLEIGSTATTFEQRPYGMELALCQRYYELLGKGGFAVANSATQAYCVWQFRVQKRASPTMTLLDTSPTLVFPSLTVPTGSGSTISAADYDTKGTNLLIDGFSGMTAQGAGYINSADAVSASAEL